MTNLLNNDALDTLVASQQPRESFGPRSNRPFLLLDLDGSDLKHAKWVSDLPCPVIGIGHGTLASSCDIVMANDDGLAAILENIQKTPVAATVLVQHLRASAELNLEDCLTAESFAYATVQKGQEFLSWLAKNSNIDPLEEINNPLIVGVNDSRLQLTLNDPKNLNAIGISMRDALSEALDLALNDSEIRKISISATGRCFSSGGAVSEFGEVSDPATAHWVRTLRLPAWRLARLKDKLYIHVNGGAVGAGAEIAAFGSHATATGNAWFQLPELIYGLIPGAGGTASLPNRIGRQRTAYLALSMKKINAQTALDWGLIDEIVP